MSVSLRPVRLNLRCAGLAAAIVAVTPAAWQPAGVRACIAAGIADRADLRELYGPDNAPLWTDTAGRPTRTARDALALLSRAAEDGLNPADYLPDLLTRLASPLDTQQSDPPARARFDLALSRGMLRFLHDIHYGRIDPGTLSIRLPAHSGCRSPAARLRAAVASHDVAAALMDIRPPLGEYARLRTMLPRYRALAADPAFATVPRPFATVHPGNSYAAASALHRQLAALGDLPADALPSDSGRYEDRLVNGVKQFQRRHGLIPDGVLGQRTFAALRVPPAARARQIELALERLRWLPHFTGDRLIALNIPMFRLWAWERASASEGPALGMDAIVGRAPRAQTPVFADEIREVVFRPYWNVPPSILRNEVLTKIARDPDYVRREDLELVYGADGRVISARQRPGPRNALGLIKFEFPNPYDVYMHGTPAQALFDRSRRDFSHGCVRVRDPVALAAWVLQNRSEWPRERIAAATSGSETIRVKVAPPIAVILFYTTAAVMPDDGLIYFADDIYGQDSTLEQSLALAAGSEELRRGEPFGIRIVGK